MRVTTAITRKEKGEYSMQIYTYTIMRGMLTWMDIINEGNLLV